MAVLIDNEKFLEKYNEIWKKQICNIIKKEFLIKSIYNKQYLRYLKTKIKVNTDFHGNNIPKKNPQGICSLSVILLDSVFTVGKDYYPQMCCVFRKMQICYERKKN